MLAEIQQTSDITYRVYDWDRQDTKGLQRATYRRRSDAIDYEARDTYKTSYKKIRTILQNSLVSLLHYKCTQVDQPVEITHGDKSSFVIYVRKGQVILSSRHSKSS